MPTNRSQRAQEGADPRAGAAEETQRSTRLSALIREVAAIPAAGASVAAWDELLRPGAVVGRFELVRELGRGGFGVVYEARDRTLERPVAFKAVLPGRRVDEAFESLQREAEALAKLAHPNIVTLLDAGRGPQGPWLAMELLRGQTLAQRLALGPVPVPEAVRIGAEVARGLAHAHGYGVIHRDLSPRNVFLCHDGQVKLLDLGLAHVFGRRRVAGGTPSYVAPEQWRDAPEDERTDVFSLGVMLFRMLAGEFPVPAGGGTPDRPVPVVEVAGAPALGPLVARMLARDPVERPRDAGEVLAALDQLRGELDRSPASSSTTPTLRRRYSARTRRALAGSALALVLVVAGLAGARWWTEAHRPQPSIAVLPFEDLSPERDQSMFAEGLAEEILGALGSVEGLRVPGRTSSFSLKGKGADLAEVGQALGVGAVLEGSVRRQGSRIKVVAQVVSVADGLRLWGRAFEREDKDAFEVQEEIAAAVVQALDVKLVRRGGATAQQRAPPAPEAYTLYLAAKEELRALRPGGFVRAAEGLERAVAIDPAFAPAWVALARAHRHIAFAADGPTARGEISRRALADAERALRLDEGLADAWSMRGLARLEADFDLQGARGDLERSLALAPNDPGNHARYAYLLQARGQHQEAIREARAAAELDPLASWWTSLGTAHLAAGDARAAEAAYRRQLEVLPAGTMIRFPIARTLLLQGRLEEARALVDEVPDVGHRHWLRGAIEHRRGDQAAAAAATDAYLRLEGPAEEFEAACLLAFTGRKAEALDWLERALSIRHPSLVLELGWTPWLEGLRDEPRFAAVEREVQALVERARR